VDWLDRLNPAQRLAVTTAEGPVLIVAGPGSGKTRVIVHRIAYLIDAMGVEPWRILAVTFTNKAAKEMRQRLDDLIGPKRAHYVSVGTFHATCARWLRQDGAELGLDPRFAILDDGDQLDLIKQAMKEYEVDEKRYSPRAVLSAISAAKSELSSAAAFAKQAEGLWQATIARLYTRYEELLAGNHGLDFDDLLTNVAEMFTTRPDILAKYQDRYPYLMVDEFQDTNVVQYQLVKLLGQRDRNVCVVGDEDQSIYGWRKADIRNLGYFERDFPELRVVMLEQNYRSTQTILDVASAVIDPNIGRKPKRLWTENPPGVPVVLHEAYDERDEALFVIRQVEALRRAGARYGDVAVTYRTNAQSRALEDALVRYGVPYRLVGGTRFYQRREVKDVVAYLRLISNPSDGVSFQRIVNVPARGIGAKTVSELQQWAARLAKPMYEVAKLAADGAEDIDADGRISPVVPLAARPRKLIGDFVAIVEAARERLEAAPLGEVLDLIFERTSFSASLVDGTEEGNDRWQNVQELRNKLHDYDGVPGPDALGTFLEEVALVQDVDSLEAGASDAITLITLHAAKGLEFPYVFIVGLEEGFSPHSRSVDTREKLEEERRLLYVGVTRAMRGLFLSHAFRRTMWGAESVQTPSRFLQDIPTNLLDTSFSQAVGGGSRTGSFGGGMARAAGSARVPGRTPSGESRWQDREPERTWAIPSPRVPGGTPPRDPYGDLDAGADDLGVEGAPAAQADLGIFSDAPRALPKSPISRPRPASSPQPARPAGPTREPRFSRGQRVRHAEYGPGTVIMGSVLGGEELALVRFDVRPDQPKNLSLAIHRLDPA
jgi:DNA helicase-2/ATP-dependent DNA helicase PcrA